MPVIRLMQASDLADVVRIQTECYVPHMNESAEIIGHRLASAPATAWVVELAGEVVAYLVAYPSLVGKVTPLGGCFAVPEEPDCLYLHDLAVSPRARGSGVGGVLIRQARSVATAAGLSHSALVAVQESQRFWENKGYRVVDDLSLGQIDNLESYAMPCRYMACRLDFQAGELVTA